MVENGQTLFAGDLGKFEILIITAFVSATLICELSERTVAEERLLEADGGMVKLASEIMMTGKISVPVFKGICGFLYTSCKMSQKVAEYVRTKQTALVAKLAGTLINKELGSDSELMLTVTGLLYSVIDELKPENKPLTEEILRVVKLAVVGTKPQADYADTVGKILGQLCEPARTEEDIEALSKSLEQAAAGWVSRANAVNMSLEILAELFTAGEEGMDTAGADEDEIAEDVKMEEEAPQVETQADVLLDAALLEAIVSKCDKWLTSEWSEGIKRVREVSSVVRTAEKIRINAYGCMLNLILNRTKKMSTMSSSFLHLIVAAIHELCTLSKEQKKPDLVHERISTFAKVCIEKLGGSFHLPDLLPLPNVMSLLGAIQTGVHEVIQQNLISVLGAFLKAVPHPADTNKVQEACREAWDRNAARRC